MSWLDQILFASLVLFCGWGEPNLDNAKTLDKILAEAINEDKIQERGEEGENFLILLKNRPPIRIGLNVCMIMGS